MKTLYAVITVAVFCVVSSAAVDFDRADPAAGVLPALQALTPSMPTPTASVPPFAAPAAPAGNFPLQGDAVGNDAVDSNFVTPLTVAATLRVGNDGKTVGAVAQIDDNETNSVFYDAPPDHRSQLVTYAFPQLRYDAAKGEVRFGDVLIAKEAGWGEGLRLAKGYRFQYAQTTRSSRVGLDLVSTKVLEVSIVRK